MWTRQYKRSPLRHIVVPVLAAAALAYFGFHGVNGSLGLTSSQEYEAELADLSSELAALKKTRSTLETRTQALSDGSLQREMIDEQARATLGVIGGNEVILLHGAQRAATSLDDLLQRTN